MTPESPGVQVSLETIYQQVMHTDTKVTKLENAVNELVSVNKRLDGHREDIAENSERIRKVEIQVASMWVITTIVITVIGAAVVRALLPAA